MRKLLMLAVVAAVAFVAMPASASVQNIKISGSIDNTYLYRDNFDFGRDSGGDLRQSGLMTQTTLRVDADLTDQVSATVELINERVWEADPSVASDVADVDLNKAYVTLRELLYSPLTVVAGRQAFSYGNSFIIDSAGANNVAPAASGIGTFAEDLTKQTNLDAIRMIFDYNPLTVELLYSKIHPNTFSAAAEDNDDHDLYGINSTYEIGDEMNTVVEGYFFASYNRFTEGDSAGPSVGKVDTIYTPGFRASTNPLEGLNLQLEYAHQFGTKASGTVASNQRKRSAHALQLISNYQVPDDLLPDTVAEVDPVLQYVFTHTSGQENNSGANCPEPPTAGAGCSPEKWRAWDPLYENQAGGTIYNSIFDNSSINAHTVSLQTTPMEDVTATLSWAGLWLVRDVDASGTVGGVTDSTFFKHPGDGTVGGSQTLTLEPGENFLGQEVDLVVTYDYTEDVQFGFNYGVFFTGSALNGQLDPGPSGNQAAATQAIVNANVNF